MFLPALAQVHQVGLLELSERHGDSALAHAEDFLQFSYAQFFLHQQAEDAEARLVAEQFETFEESSHGS